MSFSPCSWGGHLLPQGDCCAKPLPFAGGIVYVAEQPDSPILEGRDRPAITPAMIEAGIAALWPCELPPATVEAEVVARVYEAMESLCPPRG